jgi:hypothetical protein
VTRQLLAGDWEEHAVLLWNYLVWLQAHGGSPPTANAAAALATTLSTTGGGSRVSFYLVLGRSLVEPEAK